MTFQSNSYCETNYFFHRLGKGSAKPPLRSVSHGVQLLNAQPFNAQPFNPTKSESLADDQDTFEDSAENNRDYEFLCNEI